MSSAARRLAVRFDENVWNEAVRGFPREPLQIATSARHRQLHGRFPGRR
jgi:hypothetical protein